MSEVRQLGRWELQLRTGRKTIPVRSRPFAATSHSTDPHVERHDGYLRFLWDGGREEIHPMQQIIQATYHPGS